ncbi:MAG: hypothetical protein GY820_41790 [Gammaproteobacteria bacterium]|nr:hypothetical protein [Gammaproteobacteria bacterium]
MSIFPLDLAPYHLFEVTAELKKMVRRVRRTIYMVGRIRRTIYMVGRSPPYHIYGTADGLVCPEKLVTPPYHIFDRAEDEELFLFLRSRRNRKYGTAENWEKKISLEA